MKIFVKPTAIYLLLISICIFSACGDRAENSAGNENRQNNQPEQKISNSNSETQNNKYASKVPNLQAELLAQKNTKTDSPIGAFDFKNFTYPFPRGWQDNDSKEF